MDAVQIPATALIGPGLFLVFSAVFVCVFLIERKTHYLLYHAAACVLFCVGSAMQILHLPQAVFPNAVLSSVFYTTAVIAVAEGIVRRAGMSFGWGASAAMLAIVTALIWYFCYIQTSLVARVYIQNFGYGAILLIAVLRLAPRRGTKPVDQALFWIMLLFAVQFFPRTILTAGSDLPHSAKAFAHTAFWQILQLSTIVLGAAFAFAILAAAIMDLLENLRRERDQDALTGVLNRRGFQEHAAVLLARPSDRSLTLVLCDLDSFKALNDRFGHPAGDTVLRQFGAILRAEVRKSDVVARIGGEEFAILMPDATLSEAAGVAERIRRVLEACKYAAPLEGYRVTASFGIALRRRADGLSDLMMRADKLLYSAKARGRNRVSLGASADQQDGAMPLRPKMLQLG